MSSRERQSGGLFPGKGKAAEEVLYPIYHLWDVCRICCGLSHQWSAIIGIRLYRAIGIVMP